MGRKCCRHYFAFAAHIIRRHPLPQMQLLVKYHGFRIEYIQYFFWLKKFWFFIVYSLHNAGILLILPKIYFYPASGFERLQHLTRYEPGIIFWKGKWYDDLCVHRELLIVKRET